MKTLIFITLIVVTTFAHLSAAQAREDEWFESRIRKMQNRITITSFLETPLMRPVPKVVQQAEWEPSCGVKPARKLKSRKVTSFCDSRKALKNIELQSVASN